MSEMIERVARAICKADGLDPDEDWRYSKESGFMLSVAVLPGEHHRWRTYRRKAVAAIAAMREPTEAMKNAADTLVGYTPYDDGPSLSDLTRAWGLMIDAALEPPQ